MQRITTLEELYDTPLPPALREALKQALATELEIAHPRPDDPDGQGSIWLLEATDTDATLTDVFGAPLVLLCFDQVRHDPDHAYFLCLSVRNNSRCDTLLIPDHHWLPENWRGRLLEQL